MPNSRPDADAEAERRANEANLARQARLLDAALSSMADFAYVCDVEGRVTYANRALLELWQFARQAP